MLDKVPVVTDQLLAPIPRLEAVRDIILHSRTAYLSRDEQTGEPRPNTEIPIGARILKVALDFEELEAGGFSPARALERMGSRALAYDPAVFDALSSLHQAVKGIAEVSVAALRVGMIIAADVMTKNGTLLIARGHEVTPGLVHRLENFASSLVSTTVFVETSA